MTNTIRQRKEIPARSGKGGSQPNVASNNERIKQNTATETGARQRVLFGFAFSELTSWKSFVRLMCRPTDPAALGVMRFLYGVLLMIDTLEKKGLGNASFRRWSSNRCTFPAVYFLKPLPLDWMYLIYFIMFLTTIGIAFGFMYRWCLVVFNAIYWYVHLLDMQRWNNHSYLFGLLSFLLLITDGNRYLSVDSLIWSRLRNQEVPLWNYTLMRYQVFLLYFLAGIKKLDPEWLYGYSERGLSGNWVFDIFRPFLSSEMIDLYIVHRFGFFLDLSLGFLLFFDKTRKVGMLMALSFHAMNSQIFSIGMFPYIGIATLTIFCYPDWPRKIVNCMLFWKPRTPIILKSNPHCLYSEDRRNASGISRLDDGDKLKQMNTHRNIDSTRSRSSRPSTLHTVCSLFVLLYAAEQMFLPFSSVVFKGLNTWGGDLYGYTWNMMIHKYKVDIIVNVKDLETGERFDITELSSPLTLGRRYAYTPVMLVQFSKCVARKLEAEGHSNFAINYDAQLALNGRFYQRLVDPNKDMLTADWNIFSKTDWWMPVTEDFWEMRQERIRIDKAKNDTTSNMYHSDFPGYYVSFHISDRTVNNTLEVLKGRVILEDLTDKTNVTVNAGESVRLCPRDLYHLHTVSKKPSYFVISKQISSNDTRFQKYKEAVEAKEDGEDPEGKLLQEFSQKEIQRFKFLLERQDTNVRKIGSNWSVQVFITFLKSKYAVMKHGLIISMAAIRSIAGGDPFTEYITRRPF
ncbi:vitamin K-dependent gamma-carboxylase-like [Mizuhopecten yessoensis]|uniref:vitamin K-dependent gamma-carboxylase-like n=1 Tax=Mizuhopecten yessoensis TaxID=6573 RepID=UPI000B4581BD|nr:vitamin K-dependent gamma-carboxylase-like [Mizuhopecten yessoensis]